jgi:hypothetical protein
MKFLFDDDTFSFEALRTTGFAHYVGADLGEVLATADRITDGDQASWHRAWKGTAGRVAELGERSLAAGHRVTARDSLLRASNYYRNAAAFVLDNPADDPEVAALYAAQIDTFAAATALFDHPAEAVCIPYQDTTLPGYLFLVDDSGVPGPPSSTPAGMTRPARSATSCSPSPRCTTGTTCWPSTAPVRAARCICRSW